MADLSPAQLQERRTAARARWDKARQEAEIAAGAGIGGTASALAGRQIVATLRQSALADKNTALGPLRAAFRQNKQNQQFISTRAKNARVALLNERNFTSTASRAFATKFRAARMSARRLAQHKAIHSETYFDPTTGETVDATLDLPGETRLREAAAELGADRAERFRAIAADLAANGRAPRKVPRAAYIAKPKVETFFRAVRGKAKLTLSAKTRAFLEDTFARDAEQRAAGGTEFSHFHDLGIRSIAGLEQYMAGLSPPDRTGFAEYLRNEASVPKLGTRRAKVVSEVTNAVRVVPAGKTTVPGYPSPEARKKLRAELLADIAARQTHKTLVEGQRAAAEMDEAKRIAAAAGRSLQALRPGGFGRRSIVGTGIAAGILAGAFAARRVQEFNGAHVHNPDLRKSGNPEMQKGGNLAISPPPLRHHLAKANPGVFDDEDPENGHFAATSPPPENKPRTTAKRLLAAADNTESALAAGVARALAGWKAAVTPESVASPNAPGALYDQLDAPLYEGMAPMDRATAEGLTAPSRIQPPTEGDGEGQGLKPKLLHFGFNLRSKGVEDYAKRYRYQRVREITDAQRKNIKQIIVQATSKADPPAVIARKIRDVVGLTAHQAAIVANYRTMLETGDPRALGYELRDKRFDGTVKKALDAKKPLTEAQIDKMVDVYQRRFIAYRALTIARTEAIRAANNAHVKTVTDWLDKNPEYTVAKTWIATEDDRTRPDHRGLHRKTVIGMQTPFVCDSGETIRWPHDPDGAAKEVINCFHPDTIIQGDVLLATRAHYSGPMREITTRSGAKLTVTPKHPIATSEGFAGAISLRNGDNLIRYIGDNKVLSVSGVSNHEQNQPTSIKEIFDTLRNKGGATRVKVGSHNFHGDGKFCDRHIDIVFADRNLMIWRDGAQTELAKEVSFAGAHSGISCLESESSPHHDLFTIDPSAAGLMSGGDLSSDALGIGLHLPPLQQFSVRPTSNDDTPFDKSPGQDGAGDATLIGNLLQRLALFVPLDKVGQVANVKSFESVCLSNGSRLNAAPMQPPLNNVGMKATFIGELLDRSAVAVKLNKSIQIGNVDLFKSERFGPASYLDTTLLKPAGEDLLGETVFLGNLRERYPTLIEFDEIVEIRDFHYTGHVYDVQTTSKCVFAQDLLASNCRCVLFTVLIPRSAAARHGPSAYGTPMPNFWDGPRPVFDIDDPDELFSNPETMPA